MKPPCPHPEKIKHATKHDALKAMRRQWNNPHGGPLPCNVYHCRCGSWHLTSHPYKRRKGKPRKRTNRQRHKQKRKDAQ